MQDTGNTEPRDRRWAVRLESLTVGWNTLEAAVALAAGLVAGSIALVGFGLDSVIETASGLAVLWRFRQSGPAENIAEIRAVKFVGVTFFALAIYVGYEAVADLWMRHEARFSLPGMVLAAAALIVMPALGVAKRRVARRLGSRALAADGMESMLCAFLSAALLVGLALNGWLGWWWADPIAALLITGFMLREGIEAFSPEESGDD
jgi:divalent metal cation (Fe/Co/Zn/Cd) transporter